MRWIYVSKHTATNWAVVSLLCLQDFSSLLHVMGNNANAYMDRALRWLKVETLIFTRLPSNNGKISYHHSINFFYAVWRAGCWKAWRPQLLMSRFQKNMAMSFYCIISSAYLSKVYCCSLLPPFLSYILKNVQVCTFLLKSNEFLIKHCRLFKFP